MCRVRWFAWHWEQGLHPSEWKPRERDGVLYFPRFPLDQLRDHGKAFTCSCVSQLFLSCSFMLCGHWNSAFLLWCLLIALVCLKQWMARTGSCVHWDFFWDFTAFLCAAICFVPQRLKLYLSPFQIRRWDAYMLWFTSVLLAIAF